MHFRFKNVFEQVKSNSENRIQFIVKTSLSRQALKGHEYLSMKINFDKQDFPTDQQYDMVATGNLGFGLIKTINNKSPHYCSKEGCEYKVTIKTLNIQYLYLIPTITANNQEFNFQKNINILEELEPKEELTYVLKVNKEAEWRLRVIPATVSPFFYLNPGSKPSELANYFFVSENLPMTELVITKTQMREFDIENDLYYITFKNTQENSITFNFHMEKT